MILTWSMRNGATILFALSLFLAAAGIAVALIIYSNAQTMIASGALAEHGHVSEVVLLQSLVSWLGWASVPFLGAAVIWRVDRWNALGGEAAE